jgi:hypothetical protein
VLPAHASIVDVIRRSRELRCWFPESVRTLEERWLAKRGEEFQL